MSVQVVTNSEMSVSGERTANEWSSGEHEQRECPCGAEQRMMFNGTNSE
jgi:hypothetical protein